MAAVPRPPRSPPSPSFPLGPYPVNTTIELSSDDDEEMGSVRRADSGTSSPSSWRIQLSVTPTPPPSPQRLADTTIELSSDNDDLPSSAPGNDSGTSSPSSTRAARGSEINEEDIETDVEPLYDSP
jgi:hypothetical protein